MNKNKLICASLMLVLLILILATPVSAARVDTLSTFSPSMKKFIKALAVIPDGYTRDKPLPVLYLLHGYSGNYTSYLKDFPFLKQLADQYGIILVCPDGNYGSWYLDSPVDSSFRYETYISTELVNWVDNHYSTIANRSGRAITGLSMGGHGALYLAIRHQDIFGAAGSMSGGVDLRPFPDNWDLARRLGPETQFPERWSSYSVTNMVNQLRPEALSLILDCGTEDFFYKVNLNLHLELVGMNIPHTYISRPGGHSGEYWSKSLPVQLLFMHDFFSHAVPAPVVTSGNPLFPGWYADPEARIFGKKYWIYPTLSDTYGRPDSAAGLFPGQVEARKNTINQKYLVQTYLDAFSSPDLIHWTKHRHVLDISNVKWAAYSIWAPSITQKAGKYYLFFGANDIQNDSQPGGIGVAVADKPEGPFIDHLGKPLVGKFYNGAQPIDQFVFHDTDGQYYLLYGGWQHCNIGKLNADFTGFVPDKEGTVFKSITPDKFVEGVFMIVRKNKYYLMWSEGGWTGPDYSVAYAMSDSPTGPFKRIGKILQQDAAVATGAGHHSVINIPGTDDWYIIYHRRPLNTTDGNHRVVCMEHMYFDNEGLIKPVKITNTGVEARLLK